MMPAIFLSGCNFRCPYCINRELVIGNGLPELDPCQVFADLMLSGERWVMISGAEPLSDRRTPRLLEVAKSNFLKVALATNGSHYDALKGVIYSGLVDHVVMDVKTSLDIDRYREVTGIPMSEQVFGNIVKSVKLLSEVTVPVDFRMTMCSKFVGFEDLRALAEVAGIGSNVVLQPYRIHQTLRWPLPPIKSPMRPSWNGATGYGRW
jgi:pyruvate formate lyase activating enzyme